MFTGIKKLFPRRTTRTMVLSSQEQCFQLLLLLWLINVKIYCPKLITATTDNVQFDGNVFKQQGVVVPLSTIGRSRDAPMSGSSSEI